jgi:hypothetical protein
MRAIGAAVIGRLLFFIKFRLKKIIRGFIGMVVRLNVSAVLTAPSSITCEVADSDL